MDISSYLSDNSDTAAILCCGGVSRRMGENKLLINLKGKSCIRRSAEAVLSCENVVQLIVAAPRSLWKRYSEELSGLRLEPEFAPAGDSRTESVANALKLVGRGAGLVLIHDGARPLVSEKEVGDSVRDAYKFGSSVICTPLKDTVRQDNGEISFCPPREQLFSVRTPQTFSLRLFEYAKKKAVGDYTDDAQLIDAIGIKPHITIGDYRNIKLTTREDIAVAREYLGGLNMRIGQGYDVHRLVEGRKLILGGVDIPYEKGLLGQSDADVLVHAIMDALLGAASLGDIGKLFPDTDPKYSGADSIMLLEKVARRIREEGFEPENIDATVIAQAPKLRPYIDVMREKIAGALGIDVKCVSVKATTEEGLGFSGRGEGIAAQAVCLLR